MISNIKPEGFKPKFIVVGCYIEHDGKILQLKYPPTHKDNPNKWGVPAGKVDPGEAETEAMVREIFEETGLEIDAKKLILIHIAYDRYPNLDFIYYIYKYKLDSSHKPQITLRAREHVEYKWLTPQDALKTDLILDEDYCIKTAYHI